MTEFQKVDKHGEPRAYWNDPGYLQERRLDSIPVASREDLRKDRFLAIKQESSGVFRNADGDINAMKAGKLWVATYQEKVDHLTPADYLRMLYRAHDSIFDIPDSKRFNTNVADDMVCRAALGNATIVETFSTVFNNAMLAAIEDEPNTTDGWVYEGELANLLAATWFTQEQAARLERLTRGDTATSTSFGAKGEPIQLCRYASQFVIDEQNWLDGNATVGAVKLAASEQVVAAERLKGDLVYSLLLSNPTLTADNTTVFHANHHNLGTGTALGFTGLSMAMAAIGKQHLKAATDGYPTHSNLKARYLIVPPDLTGPALVTVRDMDTDGPTLKVRQESRLSSIGVVNPHNGIVYTGSATNFLVTAKASSRPSVVVAGLKGPPTPRIRSFVLDRGQWGMGWDINLDIAACFTDYRGVYFDPGAA